MFTHEQEQPRQAEGTSEPIGRTLSVRVDLDGAEPTSSNNEMGIFGRDPDSGHGRIREIPVAVLKENLQRTVSGLHEVISSLPVPEGSLPLKEAAVSFEITATGGVALIATAQAGLRGCITLTFGA